MTRLKYGKGQAQATGGVSSIRIGRATSNGTVTLSDNLSNFQFIVVATYFSSEYARFDTIPVSVFSNPDLPINIRYDANGTYHHISVAYASDSTITVSNRASLNVDFYGVTV